MAKARLHGASKPDYLADDQWRIPDALWDRIVPLLPLRPIHPLGCHNPRVADRKAMDAIFFVLRTGCQWNALNATGICSSSSAHRRFQEWTAAGVFVNLWATGLHEYDELVGLDWEWLAMDGAMTKAPLGGERTGRNPTDRGKRGTKRSLLTEAQGIPVGLTVGGANRHDKKPVEATLESIPVERPEPTEEEPQGMCLDKGYDYEDTRELVREFGFTTHVRARGEEAKEIKREAGQKARRWVVERTHSWMNRFRRLLIRWEKKAENYFGMLHFVCAWITYRAAGLLG
ncbi:IS5 family transposase [Tundrisphaera lichenicola]|uniref:IS5 family transposase n=1 Tax=Tundrisphaera lichenicola TaxID=2029860 RepID=UPI003EBC3DA9